MAYIKKEDYDEPLTQELAGHYREILRLIGENPEREGLLKTPLRVARSMQFLTKGYEEDGAEILRSAMFREEYHQMVVVKDIELYSTQKIVVRDCEILEIVASNDVIPVVYYFSYKSSEDDMIKALAEIKQYCKSNEIEYVSQDDE